MSKPTFEDKRKLEAKEIKLQEMRTQSKMKRDVTVAVSAEGFYRTGIMCDIIQVRELFFICNTNYEYCCIPARYVDPRLSLPSEVPPITKRFRR